MAEIRKRPTKALGKGVTVAATAMGIVAGVFAITKIFNLDGGAERRPPKGCIGAVEGAETCYSDGLSAMKAGHLELAKYDFRESCPPEETMRVTRGCYALAHLLSDGDQQRTYLDRACAHHGSQSIAAACTELDRLSDGGARMARPE